MNKKEKCKPVSKSNLVQMNISDSFNRWRNSNSQKMKNEKKIYKFKSTLIIQIPDSDSDPEGCTDYISSINERKLPFPFSSDNEEDEINVASVQKRGPPENTKTTPSNLVNIGVYKAQTSSHPEACSTPLKLSQSSVNNSHVEVLDLSCISKNGAETHCESGVVSDTDSERTIIYQKSNSTNRSINVIEHRIIPSKINKSSCSDFSSNVTRPEDESTYNSSQIETKLTSNSITERVAKEETVSKRRKVSPLNKEKKHVSKKLFDEKESEKLPNSIIDKENINSFKNHSVTSQTDSEKTKESNINTNATCEIGSGGEKEKENESVQSNQIKIAEKVTNATEIEGIRDEQPEQTTKNTPNQQLKNVEENQTLNKSASLSSSTSPQKVISSESTNGHPSPSSPRKAKVEAKTEGKKMNIRYVTLIQELFNTLYETNNINNLLDDDRKVVDIFRDMNTNYQYVCIKLFTWQRKWYSIFKFCNRIHLNMGDSYVCEMYNFLKEKGIVDTDFIKEDMRKLLELLDPIDLKSIRDTFKLKKTLINKQDIINSLLRCCSTQSTLTPKKSTRSILMEEIEHKLGYAVRLSESFQNAFYRAYILATYANTAFSNMTDYFKNILHLRIAFPDYPVEDYTVFYSKEEFVRYAKARKYKDGLEEVLGKNHVESLQICKSIFEELQKIKNDENDEARYRDAPHLIRFTARAAYVGALSSAMSILATKFPTDVKEWLEYMIQEVNLPHRIGEWIYHLSWLYMNYLEPRDYTHAAKLIIGVLQGKREHLSEVQLHQLGKRGQALKATKKYKISQLYHDTIAELVPEPININGFPSITVDASTTRSNELGKKRDYFVQDKEGNKTVLSVEYIALKHYLENGYTDGEHCEGSLIMATFTLFFWDIIYSEREIIPGTFVSKVQSVPLDMYTKYFYLNRKNAIDKRLEEIETTWSDSELIKFIKDKYEKYSHLVALCIVDGIIKDVELLEILIECVGRVVLAKIYKRYVENIRQYRSGLPDLLIWNVYNKKSKFVEVKGENDVLSLGQTLWLKYLQSIGADIEVCKVHSIGSKLKKTQMSEDNIQPTTSASCVISKGKKKVQKVEEKPSRETSSTSSNNGAGIEVCKVHSIGSKRKKTQMSEDKIQPTTSASCVVSKGKKKVQKVERNPSRETSSTSSNGAALEDCKVHSISSKRKKVHKSGDKMSISTCSCDDSKSKKRKQKVIPKLLGLSSASSSSDEFE